MQTSLVVSINYLVSIGKMHGALSISSFVVAALCLSLCLSLPQGVTADDVEPFVNLCDNEDYGDVPVYTPDPVAPSAFFASFGTNVTDSNGLYTPIVLEVRREWAPRGVDRFFSLLQDRYYDNAGFFRVVPDFVVQWGIAAKPEETSKWDLAIPDDPVKISNLPWTVAYATGGPDTRTTQIFINLANNSRLDDMGFAPFAKVISGFDVVLNLTNPTFGAANASDGIDQEAYSLGGNVWLENNYPNTSIVTCARLDVSPDDNNGAYDDDDEEQEILGTVGFTAGVVCVGALLYVFFNYYSSGQCLPTHDSSGVTPGIRGPLIQPDDTMNPMQK